MPYIDQAARRHIGTGGAPRTAGELNYAITQLVVTYLGDQVTYDRLNEVIGVLEVAKLEYFRATGGPYEQRKLNANGRVEPRNDWVLKAVD